MQFGPWLRSVRQSQKLTQTELSDRAGIPSVTISQVECGFRLPNFKMASAICDALGCDHAEIMTRVVMEKLLKTPEGRIFLAEARAGRFYDDDAR